MRTGQLCAKPPISPCPDIVVGQRIGTDSSGQAIWQATCVCGATFSGAARLITKGIRCRACKPLGLERAQEFMALLPATHAKLQRKFKLTWSQVNYRLRWMHDRHMCFVGDWSRAEQQGGYAPVFYLGKGEDVPCTLEPIPKATVRRKHDKRVKRAVEKALSGGREDPRYIRHIALHMAKKTAEKTREEPQTPFSALFVVAKQGRQHAD